MPSLFCPYCAQRPAEGQGACSACRPRVGSIVFGADRGPDGLVVPQTGFRYGELVQADIYFSEEPRVENLELIGRHSNPAPDRSGVLRVEEWVRIAAPSRRLQRRSFFPSQPGTAFFRDRTHFVGGMDYDVLAQHGPGRITIALRRKLVQRVLAQGSFDLLD